MKRRIHRRRRSNLPKWLAAACFSMLCLVGFVALINSPAVYGLFTPSPSPTPVPTATPTPTPTPWGDPGGNPTPTPTDTPQPTATPTPNGNNLAPIPDAWIIGAPLGGGNNFVSLDYNVEHTVGVPSIRIDSDPAKNDRADYTNVWWFNCKPGDRLIFSAWIKTGSGSGHDGDASWGGARLGIDLTVAGKDVAWHPNYNTDTQNLIAYGSGWTLQTWAVTIPSSYTGQDWTDQQYYTGTPTAFGPWLQGCPATGAPSVWFADASLTVS